MHIYIALAKKLEFFCNLKELSDQPSVITYAYFLIIAFD